MLAIGRVAEAASLAPPRTCFALAHTNPFMSIRTELLPVAKHPALGIHTPVAGVEQERVRVGEPGGRHHARAYGAHAQRVDAPVLRLGPPERDEAAGHRDGQGAHGSARIARAREMPERFEAR